MLTTNDMVETRYVYIIFIYIYMIYIYVYLFGKYNWTCTLHPQIVPLRMYQEHFALTFFNSTPNSSNHVSSTVVSSLVPFSIYQKTNPTRIVNGDMVGIYVSSA